MKKESFERLHGKVIEYATLTPFAIENVTIYDTFVIVSGNGYAVPISLLNIDPLLQDGRVEMKIDDTGNSFEIRLK